MIEVKPESVSAPSEEPRLRVGVVLEEDERRELTISVPDSGYSSVQLSAAGEFKVSFVDQQKLQVTSHSKELVFEGESFAVSPVERTPLAPGLGVTISPVVAGRGFHWRKELTQVLPGALHFYARDNSLLVVNEISFEDYLACVVSSEMSPSCPAEFVKAQAIAARSWAWVFLRNKHDHPLYTICNDDDCQRYQGTTHLNRDTLKAIGECAGEFLLFDEGTDQEIVVPAYYSKSCGGKSEGAETLFGFEVPANNSISDAPTPIALELKSDQGFEELLAAPAEQFGEYCRSIDASELAQYLGAVDESESYYRWTYELPVERLLENLRSKFGVAEVSEVLDLVPGPRGDSGRYLSFQIRYKSPEEERTLDLNSQYEIRNAFHESFLFSSAFKLKKRYGSDQRLVTLEFFGTGWGHGIGMCQIGALGMALQGKGAHEIVGHYYQPSSVRKVY